MVSGKSGALCRYTKKENADVALVVLLPSPGNDGSLLMHRLPCVEDVRDFYFPTLTDKFSDEQRSAVSNLVDSMTESRPLVVPNVALLNFYFEIERRVTDSDNLLSKCLPLFCERNDFSYETVEEAVKQAFPLKSVDRRLIRQKKYWSDIAIHGRGTVGEATTKHNLVL